MRACLSHPLLCQIVWENRFKEDVGKTCKVTVDTTDCPIEEPSGNGVTKSGRWLPFDPKWHSHKFHGAGLRYELAINIQNGYIVWMNGPFPCGQFNDIKIFKQGLQKRLLEGEKVEADGIYRNVDGVRAKGDFVSFSDKRAKARARARHETCNGRLKSFGCLKNKWRHPLCKHKHVFASIAVIVQLSIESGEPLFQVKY